MKGKPRHTEDQAERWLELTEKTFNSATYARSAFINGGLELKEKSYTTAQTEALSSIRAHWLERWYDFRTIDWTKELEYPEFTLKQTQHFLDTNFAI